MNTIRSVNQSFYLFAGTLLGSVFGLFGTFGTVMVYFESFLNVVSKKREAHRNLKKVINWSIKLREEFDNRQEKHECVPTMPISFTQFTSITN